MVNDQEEVQSVASILSKRFTDFARVTDGPAKEKWLSANEATEEVAKDFAGSREEYLQAVREKIFTREQASADGGLLVELRCRVVEDLMVHDPLDDDFPDLSVTMDDYDE